MNILPAGTHHVILHYLHQHERYCTIDVTELSMGLRYVLRIWPNHLPQLYGALIGQPQRIARGQVDITVVVKVLDSGLVINNVRKISPPRAGVLPFKTGVPLPEDIVEVVASFDDLETRDWSRL